MMHATIIERTAMTDEEMERVLVAALISVAVAAAIFRVVEQTIYRWIDNGTLEAVKVTSPSSGRVTYRVKSSSVRRILGLDGGKKEEVTP